MLITSCGENTHTIDNRRIARTAKLAGTAAAARRAAPSGQIGDLIEFGKPLFEIRRNAGRTGLRRSMPRRSGLHN